MSELYRATSPKNPDTNYTSEVVLERNDKGEVTKSIRVGGEATELTDEQVETARKYLNVRKATEDEQNVASGNTEEVSEEKQDELAVEDQTSTTPNVSPPNSPAAAEARNERGSRKGGDK